MMNNQKLTKIEAALEFLSERIADLQNPMLYKVGDRVRARGKNTLSHMIYEGDVIGVDHTYKKTFSKVPDFDPVERINTLKIYNTRSKSIHDITDLQFDIQIVQKP
jgi:hypothetical protein